MKNLYILLWVLFLSVPLAAQNTTGFSYQAVIRNANGELIRNQTISMKVSILKGSETGTLSYSEIQSQQTNENGLVSFQIGEIDPVNFTLINWADGPYYLKTETDPNGGNNYSIAGTSQLLNVPFAMYATKAANGLNYPEDPKPGDILFNNGTTWQLLSKGVNGQTLRVDNGLPNWGEPGYALPMVTTNAVTDVLQTGATSGGNVIATGYTNITARGVCWSTNQNPTTADSKTSEAAGIGTFTSTLANLITNTTYYLRAYATNDAGTAYGNQVSFKTFLNVVFPTVTTNDVTNITANAVTSGGNVTATGGGEVTERGVCWSDHQNPVIADSKTSDGMGTGEFQSQIAGLVPGSYFARAFATNSAGTGYGNMVPFTTEKTLPVLTTKAISEISAMGAVSGGNISSAGGGTISGRGICWNDSPNPTIANEKTSSTNTTASFSAAIAKASPETTYYLKAYATNEIGTGYGDQKTFTTSDAQNYTSFESGMSPAGWSGQFTVTNESAFDGSFSLKALDLEQCDETLTVTLATAGQLRFYYSMQGGRTISIYIDDVLIQDFLNNAGDWQQGVVDVSAGLHKIRWHFLYQYGVHAKCYIDQITITK